MGQRVGKHNLDDWGFACQLFLFPLERLKTLLQTDLEGSRGRLDSSLMRTDSGVAFSPKGPKDSGRRRSLWVLSAYLSSNCIRAEPVEKGTFFGVSESGEQKQLQADLGPGCLWLVTLRPVREFVCLPFWPPSFFLGGRKGPDCFWPMCVQCMASTYWRPSSPRGARVKRTIPELNAGCLPAFHDSVHLCMCHKKGTPS